MVRQLPDRGIAAHQVGRPLSIRGRIPGLDSGVGTGSIGGPAGHVIKSRLLFRAGQLEAEVFNDHRPRTIQPDIVNIHHTRAAGDSSIAFGAYADRDAVHTRQVHTLLGERLQGDDPLRPGGGNQIRIDMIHDRGAAGAIGDRHIHRLGGIRRGASIPQRQFRHTVPGPVTRRGEGPLGFRIFEIVIVVQRHRLAAALNDSGLDVMLSHGEINRFRVAGESAVRRGAEAVDPRVPYLVGRIVVVVLEAVYDEIIGDINYPGPAFGHRAVIIDLIDAPVVRLAPFEAFSRCKEGVTLAAAIDTGRVGFVRIGDCVHVVAEIDIVLHGLIAGSPGDGCDGIDLQDSPVGRPQIPGHQRIAPHRLEDFLLGEGCAIDPKIAEIAGDSGPSASASIELRGFGIGA